MNSYLQELRYDFVIQSVILILNLMYIPKRRYILIFLFLLYFSLLIKPVAFSDNAYRIEPEEISLNSEKNIADKVQSDKTFVVGGQVYLRISPDLIDFGALVAGDPILRTAEIRIKKTNASYNLFSVENHPLSSLFDAENQIPNTTCDNGTCNENLADTWSNPLTYGFGYRCDDLNGKACADDFSNDYFAYKSFTDQKQDQNPKLILQLINTAFEYKGVITYKVNISPVQKNTSYQNETTYILLPNL